MLPSSDELLTKSGRILALTIAIEQHFPVLDLGGQSSAPSTSPARNAQQLAITVEHAFSPHVKVSTIERQH
jgi:hypothetical protein